LLPEYKCRLSLVTSSGRTEQDDEAYYYIEGDALHLKITSKKDGNEVIDHWLEKYEGQFRGKDLVINCADYTGHGTYAFTKVE
jgi:hypothetical protein